MSLQSTQHELLRILAENLENPYPQVVASNILADRMNMSLTQIQQIIKSMEGLGVVESDMDGDFSLITLKGVSLLNKLTFH